MAVTYLSTDLAAEALDHCVETGATDRRGGVSVAPVADRLGCSTTSARRYLDDLVEEDRAACVGVINPETNRPRSTYVPR